jgi:hypothetical protein
MAEPEDSGPIYVLDSSGWISIEGHPAQNRILFFLIPMIEAGRIECPPEVWDELKRCHTVLAWVSGHRERIVPRINDPEYFLTIGQVTHKYPGMCKPRGSKERADGYVVALAAFRNKTANPAKRIVVAAETLASRPSRKIPAACAGFGVECIGLIEMFRREYPDENW